MEGTSQELARIIAEVLAEHERNANPLHCECGWFNEELMQVKRALPWDDPQAIREHRAHQAERIVARLRRERSLLLMLATDMTGVREVRIPLEDHDALESTEPRVAP